MTLSLMRYCAALNLWEFKLMKLTNVTFTLNDKPMQHLLWCNKVPRGKRNKPAKINGVTHDELLPTS